MAMLLVLMLAAVWGTTLTGRVVDSSTSFGVAYARLTFHDSVTPSLSLNAYTDPSGFYSLTYTTPSPPTIFNVDHAAYLPWTPPPGANTTFALNPIAASGNGLRFSLTWGANPVDLDLYVVTPCGQVYWNTRLRAIGGVPVRQDNDFTNGYGPEVSRTLDNLPCGNYDVYVRILSKSSYFQSGTATVTLWNGAFTTVQQVFVSNSGGGNFQTWYVLHLQVVLLNPAFRTRSYNVVAQDTYTSNSVPSSSSFGPTCGNDITYCRLMVPIAGSVLAPLFALLVLLMVFV